MKHFVIVNARRCDGPAWLEVKDGEIAAIGSGDKPACMAGSDSAAMADGAAIVDAQGAFMLPGLIDTHVHFREPGMTHKATIESESVVAARSGITSFFEMPNTKPPTTTEQLWRQKMDIAANTSAANYAFYIALTRGSAKLVENLPAGVPALKLFMGATTGSCPAPDDDELVEIMRLCAAKGIIITVHAEDTQLIEENAARLTAAYGDAARVPMSFHREIRSSIACMSATARIVDMAHKTGCRLHVAHVSTAAEVNEFFTSTAADKLVTAETTPMYCIPELASLMTEENLWRFKINPAIKAVDDACALKEALIAGRIDVLATDHAPHLRHEKQGGALTAASGAPSLQFVLPLLAEYLPMDVIERRMAEAPARIFGIRERGSLAVGNRADVVLLESVPRWQVTDSMVATPAGWTPFNGLWLTHKVRSVWLNGSAPAAGKAQALQFDR